MILIVDDNRTIAQGHVSIIQELGFKVFSLSDPEKVIPFIHENRDLIQVVILDIRMPKLDGITLLQKIKRCSPNIGVIMATVINDIRTAVKATKQGAYNYLIKPLQVESVNRVLNSSMELITIPTVAMPPAFSVHIYSQKLCVAGPMCPVFLLPTILLLCS